MAGTPTSLFVDLNNAQPPSFVRGPGKRRNIVNEAQKHTYPLLSRLMHGRDENDPQVFQDSHRIKIAWMPTDKGTGRFYNPGDTVRGQNVPVLADGEVGWSYWFDEKSWYAQELEHTKNWTDDAQNAFLINLKDSKDMALFTSTMNGIDRALTAVPDSQQALMEGPGSPGNPKIAYSLFAFVSEDTTNFHPSGWTTIEGKDPATEDWWRNPVTTYDADDPDDTAGDQQGLERAFDNMQMELKFDLPGRRDDLFESDTMGRQFIMTTKNGILQYKQLLRDRNDRTFSRTGLGLPDVDWSGIPLVRCEEMETNLLYDSGAQTEDTATKDGPRYVWVNGNFVFVVFHPDHFFDMRAVREPDDQIDAFFQPMTVWYNLICISRRRGIGIVTPVA